MSDFKKELQGLINKYSMENGSDTPDFLLAQYLVDCLNAYNRVTYAKEKWYSNSDRSYSNSHS